MAKKSDSTAAPKPKPIEIRLGEAEPDTLRAFGGSKSDRFNNALIDSMVKTGWFPPGQSDEDRARQLFVAVTGLQAFKPADEIEAMLAAQAMAAHHASMECSRRAMLPDQPFEAAQGLPQGRGECVPHVHRAAIGAGPQARQGRPAGGPCRARAWCTRAARPSSATCKGGDTAAVTKPAPPLAIGQEQSGMTLDDLIGKQPELVGREGV